MNLTDKRYKVIADWPGMKFTKGEVIVFDQRDYQDRPVYNFYDHEGREQFKPADFDQYPHLFKPLAWWEEREASEMPEYVEFVITVFNHKKGEVVRVFNWYNYPNACIYHSNYSPEKLIPSTLEQYNEYQKIKSTS